MVSISACSAIRLVTSGLNHTKEGRRQRSFTCGLSSSISDHLPDALIEDAVEASDSLSEDWGSRRVSWFPGFLGAAGLRTTSSGSSLPLWTAPALSFCLNLSVTDWLRLEGRSTCPTPLLKQSDLEPVVQDCI